MSSRYVKGTRLQNGSQQRRTLCDPVGSGGETTVFDYQEESDMVIGIPHEMTAEKEDRLRFLLAWGPAIGVRTKNFAWPTDLITNDAGSIVGFAMPKIQGTALADYLSPMTRPVSTTLLFVLILFRSLVGAIHAAHASGFRVADLNEQNVLVDGNGNAVIIDILSFGFVHDRLVLTSDVGVAEYLPPELQEAFRNGSLGSVQRTVHADSWAFGVLLWKALMEGYHPFSNRELIPVEEAVRNRQWPHAANSSSLHPKSASPPFTCLPTQLAELFEQCFDAGLSDPSATPQILDWYKVLDELIEQEQKAQSYGPTLASGNPLLASVLTPVLLMILIVATSSPLLLTLLPTSVIGGESEVTQRETPELLEALKRIRLTNGDQQ